MKKYIMYTILTIMSILLAPAILIGELWYFKNYVPTDIMTGMFMSLGFVFFMFMLFALPWTIATMVGGFFARRALRAKNIMQY